MPIEFYHLDHPANDHHRRAEWDNEAMEGDHEIVYCPVNPGHQRAGGRRLKDLNVTLPKVPLQDIVWTWYSECLIQDHVLEMFRQEGFTGFDVKPVTARFAKSGLAAPKLWEFVLTGWGGMARPESGIRVNEKECCTACDYRPYTSMSRPAELIDKSQWDGSDFFMVWPKVNFIFTVDRVRKFIISRKLTGAICVRPEDLPVTGYPSGSMKLREYFPDDRAHQLGDPLGIY